MTTPSKLGRVYNHQWSGPSKFKKLSINLKPESDLPKIVDMTDQFPANYDQKALGSCGPNALAGLMERFLKITNYKWLFTPSRLFIYYNTRVLQNTVPYDSGITLEMGIKAVQQFGAVPESMADGSKLPSWGVPYSDSTKGIYPLLPAPYQKKASKESYQDALLHKCLQSEVVPLDRLHVLNALADNKPFAFGFQVYSTFEDDEIAKTGIMSVPRANESLLGGHAVVAIGYLLDTPMGNDGVKDWVIVRNSWGNWGHNGNFFMPLNEVLCNPAMADDAHTLELVGF